MISVQLALELAKYLHWEPKVGDLTIICSEESPEIIEPIVLKHEKEKKIVLSMREVGDLIWLPQLARLLYELKLQVKDGFQLFYDKATDKWCYKDKEIRFCEDTPEDAAALALLNYMKKEKP